MTTTESPTEYLVTAITDRIRMSGVTRIDVTADDVRRVTSDILTDLTRPHRREALTAWLVAEHVLTPAGVWDIPGDGTIAHEDDSRAQRSDARPLFLIGGDDG